MSRMQIRTMGLLIAVLVIKGSLVSILVPAGGVPLEVYHYRIADSHGIDEQIPGGSAGIIRKELSRIIEYAVRNNGNIKRRTNAEKRRLAADLHRSGTQALVTTASRMPAISEFPGYYTLLTTVLVPLRGLDIRWRWIILRFLHLTCAVISCFIIMKTSGASGIAGGTAALWSGYIFVSGPGIGLDGLLLGPHVILVILWSLFLWRAMAMLRSYTLPNAVGMCLVAFAMSSIHLHGFIALLVTALVCMYAMLRMGVKHSVSLFIPLLFVIGGLVAWCMRGLSRMDFIGQEYNTASETLGEIFSRTTWGTGPMPVVPYVWALIMPAGLAGVYLVIRTNRMARHATTLIAMILMAACSIGILYPDVFMDWGAFAPLFAVVMGIGFSSIAARNRWWWMVPVILVCIDLCDFLFQIVGIYS